ncbi:MAG: hypothetical protein HY000_00540 [Planctomycetes bacterium]|nr:hypothetical protein [Planctomycetota bacterium]
MGDFGTTWQSCHSFKKEAEQYRWFQELTDESEQPFVVALYNEKHSTVRRLENGVWGEVVAKGTVAISGFGHFAERAVVNGFPCYNTSLQGRGDCYADPDSKFLASEDNYVLLTFNRGAQTMRIELKDLGGKVLDRQELQARSVVSGGEGFATENKD